MNNNSQNSIQERVREMIDTGKVAMRSRLHFIARSTLLIFVALSTFTLSAFLVNFILFSIRRQSTETLLGFGPQGWGTFLQFFPWPLFALDMLLIVVLISLLRTFRFGYKVPMIYVAVTLVVITLSLGEMLERHTPFNAHMRRVTEERDLPFRGFFRDLEAPLPPHAGLCQCKVIEFTRPDQFIAEDIHSGARIVVNVNKATRHATTSGLVPGDVVFIAGEYDGDGDADDVIYAFGLRLMHSFATPKRMLRMMDDE